MTDSHDVQERLGLAELAVARYALLRTFRADGSHVDTPVWFALEGQTVWFRTKAATAKVRRIQNNPPVELRICNWKGTQRSEATIHGVAFVAETPDTEYGYRLLADRYGWQWNIVPMIPIPGVQNGHQELGVRDRWRRARQRDLWTDSSIVRINLNEQPA